MTTKPPAPTELDEETVVAALEGGEPYPSTQEDNTVQPCAQEYQLQGRNVEAVVTEE